MPDQSLSKDRLQRLQQILIAEGKLPYEVVNDIVEVERIGRGLISLYSKLADNDLGIGVIKQTDCLVSSKMRGLNNEQQEQKRVTRIRSVIKGFARITRRQGEPLPA